MRKKHKMRLRFVAKVKKSFQVSKVANPFKIRGLLKCLKSQGVEDKKIVVKRCKTSL